MYLFVSGSIFLKYNLRKSAESVDHLASLYGISRVV